MFVYERGRLLDRKSRLGNRNLLEDAPQTLIDIQIRLLSCRFQLLEQPDAGAQEYALGAVGDEAWRKPLLW
jgi:hypothetical protein